MQAPRLLIISGPTASGKSALALKLACGLKGEIVNIDSVQLYRDLTIGAAKPDMQERALVPHHLLDLYAPDQVVNVAAYRRAAEQAISALEKRGKLPIFVGGSTLYISALLGGIAELPASTPELRAELESLSSQELMARLVKLDAATAEKLHANDRVRIIRAIESSVISGEQASVARARHDRSVTHFNALVLIPIWEREALYARINLRAQSMLERGLMAEVQQLGAQYGLGAQALRSLGYAQVSRSLRGEIAARSLHAEIAMHTRRFAKRQLTFWRNEPAKRSWKIRPQAGERRVIASSRSSSKKSELIKDVEILALEYPDLLSQVQLYLNSKSTGVEVWFVDAERLVQ